MKNLILKPEWLRTISYLKKCESFIDGLLKYLHDASEVGCNSINGQEYEYFLDNKHLIFFKAIKSEFDKLNFPPDNDVIVSNWSRTLIK